MNVLDPRDESQPQESARTDLAQAAHFIELLTGSADTQCTWQTFDDDSSRKRKHLAQVLHGPLSHVAGRLEKLSAEGAGVFVTVNATDLVGRRSENITALRALFVDSDTGPIDLTKLPAEPSFVVNSSRGQHAYWLLVPDQPIGDFTEAQEHLAEALGTDPKIHDLPRVMRVPGFLHRKGKPFLVTVASANPSIYYSIAQVTAGLPPRKAKRDTWQAPAFTGPVPSGAGALDRCHRYFDTIPGAVEGNGGDHDTYRAACVAVRGFNLSDSDALEVLERWNRKCSPPWEARDLVNKVKHARLYGKGSFGSKLVDLRPRLTVVPSAGGEGAPVNAAVEPFPTITYSGLPTPARWLFPQLIEQGTCAVIGAEPKAGKSWVTFDLAIALATGQRFLNDFTPAERGTTLLYSPEGSSRSQHGRLVGLCWGREIPPELVLPHVRFIDAHVDLNIEDHAARLGATIDATGARLVVIDPMVSAAMGIDENASGDVMRILNPLRAIIKARPNCALIVVHHTNKMARGQAMSLGLRGSSAIMGWLDTLITIRRAEDDSSGPRRVDIQHRDAMAPEPLGFQLAHDKAEEAPGLQWFRLTRCEVPNVDGKRKEAAPLAEAVASVMADGAWHSGNDVVRESSRNRNQVLAELRQKAADGVLEYDKKHGYRVVSGFDTTYRGNQNNDE